MGLELKSEIQNPKSEIIIEILLILLLVFTPVAYGSQVLWAFSLMELGILLIIILWAGQVLITQFSVNRSPADDKSEIQNPKSEIQSSQSSILKPQTSIGFTILLISLFLGLVLFQMIPLPAGIIKLISPKTYELRTQLSVTPPTADPQSEIQNPKSTMPSSHGSQSAMRNAKSEMPFFPLPLRSSSSSGWPSRAFSFFSYTGGSRITDIG
jgi:hypothetical protein